MGFCRMCGNKLNEDDLFCTACGAKVKSVNTETSSQNVESENLNDTNQSGISYNKPTISINNGKGSDSLKTGINVKIDNIFKSPLMLVLAILISLNVLLVLISFLKSLNGWLSIVSYYQNNIISALIIYNLLKVIMDIFLTIGCWLTYASALKGKNKIFGVVNITTKIMFIVGIVIISLLIIFQGYILIVNYV